MKFTLLQENLTKALSNIMRVVPARPQLPILSTILIKATKEGIEIIATNAETTEKVWLGGKVEKEGSTCVAAKVFFELITSFPAGAVTVSLEEETMKVSCSGYNAELPTILPAEFPYKTEGEYKELGKINGKAFVDALSRVLFTASTDEGRPVLTGVQVSQDEGRLSLAATDGYRLSVYKSPLESEKMPNMVIPAKVISEVIKLLHEEKDGGDVTLLSSEGRQVAFIVSDTTIITRLLEGSFPDFARIIPKTHTARVEIEKEPLLQAVRSAAIFARDNANIVRFVFTDNVVRISANAAQIGKSFIDLDVKKEGDDGEIAFNSRFLVDYLVNCPDDVFVFEMTGSLNPGAFKQSSGDQYLHIIMPVRTGGET